MNAPETSVSGVFVCAGKFSCLPHLRDARRPVGVLHWLYGNFRGLTVTHLLQLMRVQVNNGVVYYQRDIAHWAQF
jgi:hypothetical protein